MLLIPAIRLRDGKILDGEGKSALRDSPTDAIARFRDAGAERVQIVDEGSLADGTPRVLKVLENIATKISEISLQVVTGAREEEAVQSYLETGVAWLVLGHRAASAPHVFKDLCLEFPGHIMIGLSVRDGRMQTETHSKLSNHELVDLATHFQDDGAEGIVYQEIDAREKPVLPVADTVSAIAGAVSLPVFLAGRIDSRKDLDAALAMDTGSVAGVILNRPLDGDIEFAKAMKLVGADA